MQLTRPAHTNCLSSVLMLALLLGSGCFRWLPIEPDFDHGAPRNLDKVRLGGEGGEVVDHARIAWPMLEVVKAGQPPLTLDLRNTPAARRVLTGGGIAAIVVPSVVAGVGITAVIFLVVAFKASYAGG